ncbi:hypothetical protein M3P19_12060 [Muricauda sp. 2012CJ35-5]|uniref:Uncharacterized protein n=1 Tax=Flagellimonas spongiicola TaxID=2942208 RepID=A0ABT0PU65_9FLAO|nr:hypothetical protein [Allomuricauda spongiicola]MCL6274746.1 hypothetical protein [Allomuricauda spongiicola]
MKIKAKSIDSIVSPDYANSAVYRIELPDTLNLKLTPTIDLNEKQTDNDSTPWIVALAIGIISALVHIIVAFMQRKSMLQSTNSQITNSKENIKSQIESNKQLKLAEFQANLKVQNQQDNLNTIIDNLTDFLSHTIKLTPNKNMDIVELEEVIAIIHNSKLKIELLLNPKIQIHSTLIDSLNQMIELIAIDEPKDFKFEQWQNTKDDCVNNSRLLILSIKEEINHLNLK